MFSKLYFNILKKPLRFLLIFGLIERILILLVYNGVTIFPDSRGYIEMGPYITNMSMHKYGGWRTPGYPLLISLCRGNLYAVVIVQQILGLISIYLTYDFSLKRTADKTTSFWITFITMSFMHFVFYEFAILTETLSLFLILLSFWVIQSYDLFNNKSHSLYFVLLSIIMAFLYLTRPMFIYLPIAFVVFYLLKNPFSKIKRNIKHSVLVLLFPALAFYGWSNINQKNTGYFTTTIYFGYNLTQMATSFFDKVPDEHKTIKNIFLKHRAYVELNEHVEQYPMTIWYAYDDLIEATNLSPQDLSNKLSKISKDLFKSHPELYLKQVVISWFYFWGKDSTFLVNKEKFANFIPKYLVFGIWRYLQQYILVGLNILFVLFSIKPITNFLKLKIQLFDLDLFLVLFVIGGSIAQAIVAFGNNSRFAYPYLPLIVYFVIKKLIQQQKQTY